MRSWLLAIYLTLFCGIRAEVIDVAVGQLFSVRLDGDDSISSDSIPGWMSFDASQSTLFGVPRWNNFENVTLPTKRGRQIEINIHIEFDQCAQSEAFIMLESYEDKPYDSYKIEDLRELIKDFAETFDLENRDVRAYRADEVTRYREFQETLITLNKDLVRRDNVLVLWSNILCGNIEQAGEERTDLLSKASELDSNRIRNLQLTQARVKKEELLALQTATPAPIARTTRMIKDNPPNRYNNIDKFECQKGRLCQKWLPSNTFIDSEDGQLQNLRSKVFNDDKSINFLTVVHEKEKVALEGVPLSTGIFSFRLEVRDSADQMAAAAFSVEVKDEPEPNHLFEMVLDTKFKRFQDEPKLLVKFGEKLVERIGGNRKEIAVNSVEEDKQNTVIRWSNSSLSRVTCEEKLINATKTKMTGKGKERGIRDFAKHMGADFAIRDVSIKLQGTCGPQTVSPKIVRVHASTISTPLDEEGGISNIVLLVLIVVAIVLLLAILFVVFCCIKRKQAPKKSQEYTTKGTPIVFPDDVRQDDETNGSTAAVTTPMLVSHEHPPLNPNTTLHENPIYKPPSEAGTPTRSAVGQRLPPPYMAP
ncbi:unnamed protein product [Bursaphelenchus okinawaensis]|uniref:Peptidase S72 domain-containing protein n=1 Tax=Bursaphelenchus okinawaensis TaxID=465554 RepID=A0A811KUI9_9BILA|nr:unnamed protein product [Bursaphelenchus okinawaensis]CAG9112340.1 unnamed protein product [Bursaphelenchus okinawaensis]